MRLDNFINTHSRQTTKLTDKPCHHHLNYFHFVPSCEWVSECVRVLLNLLLIWLIRFIQLSLENRQHFINFNLRGCLDRVTAQIRLSCPIDQNSTLVHRDTHADTISSTWEQKKLQTAHTQIQIRRILRFVHARAFVVCSGLFFSLLFFQCTWMNLGNKIWIVQLCTIRLWLLTREQSCSFIHSVGRMHHQSNRLTRRWHINPIFILFGMCFFSLFKIKYAAEFSISNWCCWVQTVGSFIVTYNWCTLLLNRAIRANEKECSALLRSCHCYCYCSTDKHLFSWRRQVFVYFSFD